MKHFARIRKTPHPARNLAKERGYASRENRTA
jgi:hypothetical protein